MTNVAIALRLRPDLESKIRRLVFMGGTVHARNYDNRAAGFNFWFDPEAAQVVLRSGIRQKTMFGLDICNRARINRTHFDQIVAVKTPITELFREDMGIDIPDFSKNGMPRAISGTALRRAICSIPHSWSSASRRTWTLTQASGRTTAL